MSMTKIKILKDHKQYRTGSHVNVGGVVSHNTLYLLPSQLLVVTTLRVQRMGMWFSRGPV